MTFLKESVMETLVKEIRQCVAGLSGCADVCVTAGRSPGAGSRGLRRQGQRSPLRPVPGSCQGLPRQGQRSPLPPVPGSCQRPRTRPRSHLNGSTLYNSLPAHYPNLLLEYRTIVK